MNINMLNELYKNAKTEQESTRKELINHYLTKYTDCRKEPLREILSECDESEADFYIYIDGQFFLNSIKATLDHRPYKVDRAFDYFLKEYVIIYIKWITEDINAILAADRYNLINFDILSCLYIPCVSLLTQKQIIDDFQAYDLACCIKLKVIENCARADPSGIFTVPN